MPDPALTLDATASAVTYDIEVTGPSVTELAAAGAALLDLYGQAGEWVTFLTSRRDDPDESVLVTMWNARDWPLDPDRLRRWAGDDRARAHAAARFARAALEFTALLPEDLRGGMDVQVDRARPGDVILVRADRSEAPSPELLAALTARFNAWVGAGEVTRGS